MSPERGRGHCARTPDPCTTAAPVRDLARLLRDVVASVLVQLEGQGGHPGSDGGLPCYLDRAPGATRGIPATTCPRSQSATAAGGHQPAAAGLSAAGSRAPAKPS